MKIWIQVHSLEPQGEFMEEGKSELGHKARIEKARKDPSIMALCQAEYLGDNGEFPPKEWEPSDEEVFEVIERIGFR